MNNVIARYHKFVKPAFDEYIRPTRKMADVIIPRGAENYVAIDLVAQHLKYQISKMFSDKNISLEKPLKAIAWRSKDFAASTTAFFMSRPLLYPLMEV